LSMYNGNTPGLPSLVGRKPESFRNCNNVVVVLLLSLLGSGCVAPNQSPDAAIDHLCFG
jgi:hypothetical protein